jgi:hypothetical protein
MKKPPIEKSAIEMAGQDLFNYAIERDDVNYLLALLPQETTINPSKAEYELQLLKIITVGWSVSYHLQDNPLKDVLSELFWQAVNQFSHGLSETTGMLIGQDIDYFEILKQRLDMYLAAMHAMPDAPEPAHIIGTAFAGTCGNAEDIFAVMTGTKMFSSVTTRVRQYLETAWAAANS